MLRQFAMGVCLVICSFAAPVAAQWGTLTGQFIYDGTPPATKAVNVTKI